jgi:uncharacterized membrane protein YqaE (UPF0057 family)
MALTDNRRLPDRRLAEAGALKETNMRLIIALLLPSLSFFTIGRPIAASISLILQLSLMGWVPATMWAVYTLTEHQTNQRIQNVIRQAAASPKSISTDVEILDTSRTFHFAGLLDSFRGSQGGALRME